MNYSDRLRKILLKNAKEYCSKNSFYGIEHDSAFLFNDISMNFNIDSYKNICQQMGYVKRLNKQHSNASGYKEMQSSNSSDALLMNIFGNPNIKNWKSLRDLLKISTNDNIEFGWNPQFENEKNHKTEIDMLIGNNIFEAKLTEKDFTIKDLNVVLSYSNVEQVFDLESLILDAKVYNYQLIRNILTAFKYDFNFILIVDERRIDLIREFYKTKSAIKVNALAIRCDFITWQEIASCLGKDLKKFIIDKYLK